MAEITEYCSEDVSYPIVAHAAVLSVSRPDGSILLFPNRKVHVKVDDIVKDIKELELSLTKDGDTYSVLESCIILPLRLFRRFPLKKEYWANPSESFADTNRSTPFVKAIYNPSLFTMLITPSKEGDVWRYHAALPIPVSATDTVIEQFMLHSDWPVAETAKQCAIYTIEQPFLYDWILRTHAPIPQIRGQIGIVH
jgi:hypothetical protein